MKSNKKKYAFLFQYYNNMLTTNYTLNHIKKWVNKRVVCVYPIYYRDVRNYIASGNIIRVTKKNKNLNYVLKIQCHVTKMDFFLDVPVQTPLISIE